MSTQENKLIKCIYINYKLNKETIFSVFLGYGILFTVFCIYIINVLKFINKD